MAVKFNRFMALAMCATALTPVAAYAQETPEETAASDERRFGAIVESLGATPAQIVVERAMYNDANGVVWAAGTNNLGTRLR